MIYVLRLFAAQFFPKLFWNGLWLLLLVLLTLLTIPTNQI